MKKITLLLIMTCLFALKGYSQTQFWSDTFDSSPTSGTRTTEENGGTSPLPSLSYFKLTDGSTISQVVPFTGKEGSFFWAGEDHNALGTGFSASGAVTNQTASATTNELQIDWTGINIAGKTGLSFKGLIAAASTNEPWDNTNACISGVGTTNTDYIIVEYSIDGSPYTSLIRFFNRGSASGTGDKYLFEDTDGNGCGDGTQLTNAFNEFTKNILGTGNTLSLRIRIFSEGNNEEWGIDNFRLFEAPSCPTVIVTPLAQTNVSCNGGSNGSASVTASGGTGLTYNWSPGTPSGDGTATVTGLTPGLWTCTVTNSCGNSSFTNITITQPTAIVVSPLSQTNVSCFGGSNGAAQINTPTGGTGSYTYNWTPGNPIGDGTRSVTGLSAGIWTCTVTDANGCTAVQNFNLNQPTALTVTPASQTNVSCFGGSNGAASINIPTGGAGGYTYNWTPGNPTGDGTTSVTGLSAGTWTCTVTDANGCIAVQTFNLNQPTALTVTPASQTNVSCFGGSNGAASINTPTGGAGGYTYNWTPGNPSGDGTTSVTGLSAGTWTCTVTDVNGCTAVQTFNLNQPTALTVTPASQTNVSCFGGSNGAASINTPTGGAGGYTYNWTPGNPTGDGTTSVNGLTAGTWTCTVTDVNGCTAVQTFNLNQPTALTVIPASQTNVSCFGGSNGAASINTPTGGAGGYTYDWTPGNPTGDGTTSVTGLTAGTWTCTVTDVNGCIVSQNFTVTEPAVVSSPTATATQTFCNGATVANLAATGSSLQWYLTSSGGSPLASNTVLLDATNYYVSQTIGSCESNRTTVSVTLSSSSTNTTTVSACDSYTWTVNGTTYTTSGTYNFVSGCNTEVLNLTINPSTTNTTTATACDSYTWTVNGTTYTTSGTYNFVSGCNTEVLNLTINPSTTNTTTASACDSYTWAVNGSTYTTSGTYNFVSGCLTEILNLTITPSTTNTTTASVCDSYTWAANGTTYTTSGTYNFVSGCVNEVLNLTITPTPIVDAGVTPATACANSIVVLTGTTPLTTSSGFTGAFAPANWNFVNTNANGSVNTAAAPASIAITGGNNGSGSAGNSNYTIVVPTSGNISFNWNYTTTDGANWDRPRILINGTPTVLTGYNTSGSTSQSGTMTVPVTAGQTFGFNVFTLDNSFGAATVTFSNFVASTPTLQWTASNGGTIVGANNQLSVSVSSAGTYTLTASNGTCTAFDSVDVNYFIATPQPTANATQSFCDAATVNNLQATGTAIQWFVAPTGGTALNATDALTNATTYYVSQTLNGCESTRVAVSVVITPSTTNTTTASACDSYTWAVNGTTYTTSGTYNFVSGCNTEILNLTITPSTTNTTTASACDSYTWTVNGTTYTTSGSYNFVSGCNTEVLNLTITPSTTNTTDITACDTYTWAVNGTTYTTSGSYNFVSGCNTEVLNLTITPSTTNTTTASACDSYTWTVNGTTYSTSGSYNFVSGCNTEVLNLTITPSTTNTTNITACDTYTWAVNGSTYTTSGTYNFVSGCLTEVLNLTITPSTTNTTTASVCDSYTWAANGTTYSTSGTYNFVSGCATEILNLTITPTPIVDAGITPATACADTTVVLTGTVSPVPSTGFTGAFAPANWNFVNTNANGSVNAAAAPTSIAITGGNNGSGSSGNSNYTIVVPASGNISFNWSYNSADGANWDRPRILINGTPTVLTGYNTSGSSTQSGT
ncbi:hypothetical protein, partial [Flavobacterium sp.]|uniref:beta strand repeat-containing protein n=1 Tax=Flavobacterium sp. TaxID=239 RepID=UPI00262FD84D